MTMTKTDIELYEFYRNLYIKAATAHEEIHRMCREGATLDEIKKVAQDNIRIEGV